MHFTHRIYLQGIAGRTLCCMVERLSDGAYYRDTAQTWGMPGDGDCAHMVEVEGGYAVDLPTLDPAQDYCLYIRDAVTYQLDMSQLIDGCVRPLDAVRGPHRKGPTPRNASPSGFVFCVRAGRQVELE